LIDEGRSIKKEDEMIGYFFAFALIGVLIIASGVYMSLYLYNGGAVGNRRFRLRRFRRVRPLPLETPATPEEMVVEEGVERASYMDIKPADDSTARFARVAVLVFIGCVLVLILLIATFINSGIH
jgi:hypothetical protein